MCLEFGAAFEGSSQPWFRFVRAASAACSCGVGASGPVVEVSFTPRGVGSCREVFGYLLWRGGAQPVVEINIHPPVGATPLMEVWMF